MKFVTLAMLILLTAATASAQSMDCPVVTVLGPAGIVGPGEAYTFKASVKGLNAAPTYNWEVFHGQIASGQGTDTVTVYAENEGKNLTARVRVSNVPEGCGDSASVTVSTHPHPILLEPAVLLVNEEITLDGLAATASELKENPTAIVGVVIETAGKESLESIRSKVRQSAKKLSSVDGLDTSRIVFILRRSAHTRTTIYLVPAGSSFSFPSCKLEKDCLTIYYEKLVY